jgi:hypothetical protein
MSVVRAGQSKPWRELRPFETYFNEIDTAAKVYWLGFIFADGCVVWHDGRKQYILIVQLAEKDAEHLAAMDRDMGGNREPRPVPSTRSARMAWYSKPLCERLIALGVMPRKSAGDTIPAYPPKFERDFWRGFFDGDGCISWSPSPRSTGLPVYRANVCGAEAVVLAFQAWAMRAAGVHEQTPGLARSLAGCRPTYVIQWSGNRQVAALTTALYHGSTRYLPRKFALHTALLTLNERTTPSVRNEYPPA